jgi:hypothetical protein
MDKKWNSLLVGIVSTIGGIIVRLQYGEVVRASAIQRRRLPIVSASLFMFRLPVCHKNLIYSILPTNSEMCCQYGVKVFLEFQNT